MKFSVIIPTYNRPDQLDQCLSALVRQRYPREGFEVVVVDDGSSVDLAPVVARYEGAIQIRLVRKANGGPGQARNFGARVAQGRFLAFTDDDCLPAPAWLSGLETSFDADPTPLVGGRMDNGLKADVYAIASQVILEAAYAQYDGDTRRGFFASCNMAVERSRFLALGGFDPSFRIASEDREICDRWQDSGGEFVFAEDALILHAHHSTLLSFLRQHFRYGQGARRFHEVRAQRGGGKLTEAAATHGSFLTRLVEPLWQVPVLRKLPVVGALTAWQIANAAGYLYEAGMQKFRPDVVALPTVDLNDKTPSTVETADS